MLQPEDFRDGLEKGFPQRLRSVGRPALGVKVRVVGADGSPMGPNELGEIATSGGNLITGYLNNPQATAEAIRDGIFYTGDLGMFDEDGLLYLKGRKSDTVVVDGKLVLPQEVEAIILRHQGVRDAAVTGIADDSGEFKVVAFVISETAVAQEEILSLCRDNLPPHAVPSEMVLVESFPKTASGKVMKHKLVDQYQ